MSTENAAAALKALPMLHPEPAQLLIPSLERRALLSQMRRNL